MVSNASELLPEPERPVTTINLSLGISRDTFFKLCTRAPCTAIVVRAAGTFALAFVEDLIPNLELIRRIPEVNKRHFLHFHVASLRQLHRSGRLADQTAIREVFASRRDAANAEIAFKIIFDFGC